MMEEQQRDVREVHNHFAEGSNCQVFNGNISGCVFAMPGSTVTQQAAVPVSKQAAPVAAESGIGREDSDEELFRFIHPAVEDEEAWRIHHAIKRLQILPLYRL